jgi:hypothetical protein
VLLCLPPGTVRKRSSLIEYGQSPMDFETFLSERKTVILARCLDLMLDVYPPETAQFLRSEKDRFLNPVWHTFTREMSIICDQITGGPDMEKAGPALENILRVMAVQGFSPSQAISFVYFLKKAAIEEMMRIGKQGARIGDRGSRKEERGSEGQGTRSEDQGSRIKEQGARAREKGEGAERKGGPGAEDMVHALLDLDERTDRIACAAFDIYMKAREKIFEIRIKEIKATHRP